MKIADLGFSTRTLNCLHGLVRRRWPERLVGIAMHDVNAHNLPITIEELRSISDNELMKVRNLGRATIAEIRGKTNPPGYAYSIGGPNNRYIYATQPNGRSKRIATAINSETADFIAQALIQREVRGS